LGIASGGMTCALFVPDQDVPDAAIEDRVIRRKDRAAGDAEHYVDASVFQGAYEARGSSNALAHRFTPF
jgi:hypothetical protein